MKTQTHFNAPKGAPQFAWAALKGLLATKLQAIAHASVVAGPLYIVPLLSKARAKLSVARSRKKTSDDGLHAPVERRFFSATKLQAIAAGPLILALTGCVTGTQHHALSQEQQVRLRSIQTRTFQVQDKKQMMQAVMSTLQDLGFGIEKADYDIGLVTAIRLSMSTLRITVTVRPDGRRMLVRANARLNLRAVTDPEPYQKFFGALNKSAFLESQLRAPQNQNPASAASPLDL